jgi:HK97 family phage portal protein
MDLLSRIQARRRGEHLQRAWPVGKGELIAPDYAYGHDQSEFSSEEYGDYAATSNEIYSVITQRARLMSGIRLKFYRGQDSDKVQDTTHPSVALFSYVNPFWTGERLARMDEMCMGLWGGTCWALEGPKGAPKEIWWLKPTRVKPVVDESEYISGYKYHSVSGEILHFEPWEIVWQRYPNPIDEFSALSPLAAARLAADTARDMAVSNQALFKRGMQIAGIIVPPGDKVTFSKEQAQDLEKDLDRRLTGADKAHRWAVLRYEAQFKQMAITPKDAEYISGLGLTYRQVCRAYGMQPALLGDTAGATLANVTAFERIEWTRALKPDAEFKAAEVREQYLSRFRGGGPDWCEFDFSTVPSLQESETESWLREAQALDRGAITINEWRASKGKPKVPWGDRPYMPVNKAPLDPATGLLEMTDTGDDNSNLPDMVKKPDDEVNPSNQPPQVTGEKSLVLDHLSARKLLASFGQINGVRL